MRQLHAAVGCASPSPSSIRNMLVVSPSSTVVSDARSITKTESPLPAAAQVSDWLFLPRGFANTLKPSNDGRLISNDQRETQGLDFAAFVLLVSHTARTKGNRGLVAMLDPAMPGLPNCRYKYVPVNTQDVVDHASQYEEFFSVQILSETRLTS